MQGAFESTIDHVVELDIQEAVVMSHAVIEFEYLSLNLVEAAVALVILLSDHLILLLTLSSTA